MSRRIVHFVSVFIFLSFLISDAQAQLGKITVDLQKDKPEKFKNKTLRSEKTGEKKFNLPRRFIQNTVSHYNYFFNANRKIDEVIDRARRSTRDDYTKLLPFYPYSVASTKAQAGDLDSVIQKATAGILLHDLRSDWVDDLYLLIGEAYYLRGDYDSAAMTFQFINYNLQPRNKKSDDDRSLVGSNEEASAGGLSISTKEDRSMLSKAFSRPPARNDALIWQIRTYIDMEQYGDAAGLINTLKNDPYFPERLNTALKEMQGYWFFSQQVYDSAAPYIAQSLSQTLDLADKARREFLLAQLYEGLGAVDTASRYYERAIAHTTDPLMDIYASLNKAKMLRSDDPREIGKTINYLLQMARKDKFDGYRDIIFYSAAQLALEIPDTTAAVALLKKSNQHNETNIGYKNLSFLQLAEISYLQKDYRNAYAFYDSLQAGDSTLGDMTQMLERKRALAQVVRHINVIAREDSLQMIAGMLPADRENFIKRLSRKLSKERGLTETYEGGNAASAYFGTRNRPTDIFGNNNEAGDWYFYNTAVKTKGYNEFKRIWGKRSNVDNWRQLSSDENAGLGTRGRTQKDMPTGLATGDGDPLSPTENADGEIPGLNPVYQEDVSPEGLLANVPLTQPMLDTSNARVAVSLYQLGKNYQNLLEDYTAAIDAYERSLTRFPDSLYNGELYMNLSYCYSKTGQYAKAEQYKNMLLKKFEGTRYAQMIQHPEQFNPNKKDTAATNRYTGIYNLFIEGNFEQAIREKRGADSLYGASYWTPQLLYIESVYHIRQHADSTALQTLATLVTQYPESPLRQKAVTLMDVLKRRDSIENYLTNLQVERVKEADELSVFDDTKTSRDVNQQTERQQPIISVAPVRADTATLLPERQLPAPVKRADFTFDAMEPQYVVMLLKKVDPVYASEARNAFIRYNREKFYQQKIDIVKDTLDGDRSLLVFSSFLNAEEAMKYVTRISRDAASEVSWLPADKYSFYIISAANLELLKENKKLEDYIQLLNTQYPGVFR